MKTSVGEAVLGVEGERALLGWVLRVSMTTRWERLECSWTRVADSHLVRRPCCTRDITSSTVTTCLQEKKANFIKYNGETQLPFHISYHFQKCTSFSFSTNNSERNGSKI